jgi:D-alanine-D-alanine ligase
MAKRVVRDQGVLVADFTVIESETDIVGVRLPFPLFLKPIAEGSGKGVGAMSKVDDAAALARTAHDLLARFHQPVLVEEFLPGREFTVGITGTGAEAKVLGVSEIVPKDKYVGHGYGFENKEQWHDKLDIARATDVTAGEAGEVALAAWRALRCRDGGRVDIRQDRGGKPCFIEVNPLAGIRPGYSDLCFIAEFEGVSYQALIGLFVESFLRRHPELRSS